MTTTLILQDKAFAEERLLSAVDLLDKLGINSWPFSDPVTAIAKIRDAYTQRIADLRALDDEAAADVVEGQCRQARRLLVTYSGFTGFALRSTNVRNAFEAYMPIRSIGEKLLGAEVFLIIGSEWNYAPFAYPMPASAIENFILVGLPASEAQNGLLLPIAGHELGHAVWRRKKIGSKFQQDIEKEIARLIANEWSAFDGDFPEGSTPFTIREDLEARSVWSRSYTSALRQCEELFCDCVGLYIFSNGFFHAFRYLLAYDQGVRYSELYPPNILRAQTLMQAAEQYDCSIEFPYKRFFRDPGQVDDKFLRIADLAVKSCIQKLIGEAELVCVTAGIPKPDKKKTAECVQLLRSLAPPSNQNFADVINAAWEIRYDLPAWQVHGVEDERKPRILNDLIFKSLEFNEVAS